LSFATFRLPREATLFEVIDNARARVDAVLTIGEIAHASPRATEGSDRAS
jgi:hypothetical protein